MSRLPAIAGVGVLIAGAWAFAQVSPLRQTGPAPMQVQAKPAAQQTQSNTETYRLVQTRGNEEYESARGLSKRDCEARRDKLKTIATALGTYNEALGVGSITCLPESIL